MLEVRFEFGLDDARLLEIADIPEAIVHARWIDGGISRAPERYRETHHRAARRAVEQGRVPRDETAPVVADQDVVVMAERTREAIDIASQRTNVVVRDSFGTAACTVTALVGYGDAITGGNDGIDLIAPQIPALRPAVEQDDQGAVAFDDRAQMHAIGRDGLEIARLHRRPFSVQGAGLAPSVGTWGWTR